MFTTRKTSLRWWKCLAAFLKILRLSFTLLQLPFILDKYMSHEALSLKITQLISLAHLFGQDVREDSSIAYNISPDLLLSFE